MAHSPPVCYRLPHDCLGRAGNRCREPGHTSITALVLAGGLLAAALICIALAVAGVFSLNRQIKDFQRVLVPGQAEVTFAQLLVFTVLEGTPGPNRYQLS
jgi:hypothetical protein